MVIYPTRNFAFSFSVAEARARQVLLGGWSACAGCEELIDRGARDELTTLSHYQCIQRIATVTPLAPVESGRLHTVLRRLHDDFWAHREGPARAL